MKRAQAVQEQTPGMPGDAAGTTAARAPTRIEPRMVKIADIHVPADNFRHGDHDAAAIDGLMASMRMSGQQIPIRLRPWNQGGTWAVVFGFRRLEAARRLGWPEISADCHAAPITDQEVLAIRAIENLHRLDLDPIEEAAAVCALIESVTGSAKFAADVMDAESGIDVPASAIQEVAAMLARSQDWVRHRIIFARLSPKVRAALAAGLLPLGHAREIAKLADPGAQDELLSTFERREDGSGGRDLDHCKRLVAERLRKLKGTAFRVDVAWAGKRDCLSCPHNSAQVHSLFATGGESELADARCMDGACFGVKAEAAERAVAEAVKSAQARDIPTTKLGLAMVTPEGMKMAAVERAILKARGQLPAGKATAEAGGNSPEERFRRKVNAWVHTVADAIWTAALNRPLRTVALGLAADTPPITDWPHDGEAKDNFKALVRARPLLSLVAKADLKAVERLAEKFAHDNRATPFWVENLAPAVLANVAAGWNIDGLPDFPTGVEPEPGACEPAKKGRIERKVRTCRVCGCTDDTACIDEHGQACHWIAKDLCSACRGTKKPKAARKAAKAAKGKKKVTK